MLVIVSSADLFFVYPIYNSAISVAFINPEVEYHHTYVSYDLISLVGEVGGIIGITLGASALTLFESLFPPALLLSLNDLVNINLSYFTLFAIPRENTSVCIFE